MRATRRDLEIQFNRVVTNGWLSWFQREAVRAGTTTAHLLAIGSRETNLKNIKGDYRNGKYNGFGVMQVDIGTDPVYAKQWTPQNVEPSIRRGVDIYISKVRDTANCVGKRTQVRSRFFVGRAVDSEDLRRVATAAYNCGRWAHYHFSNSQNVDSTTTGKDYSRDVYDRALEFAEILEQRGLEQNAICNEMRLQGKYARDSHRKRFGLSAELPKRIALPTALPQESFDELAAVDYEREIDGEVFYVAESDIDHLVDNIGPISTEQEPAGSTSSLPQEPALQSVGLPKPEAVADSGAVIGDGKPAEVTEPEPYNGIGFWATIKRDLIAVTGGNLGFESLATYAQQASGWPSWVIAVISKLAVIVAIACACYLAFRVIHFLIDSWKKNKRVGYEVLANTAIDRRDIEWKSI
jgi:hypothetical protein